MMKTLIFLGLLINCLIFSLPTVAGYQDRTFSKLENILDGKKRDILSRLDIEKEKVASASKDAILLEAFWNFQQPSSRSNSLDKIKLLDGHYIANYSEFYDILFIAEDGLVFHSIKMESDFRQNLFDGELSNSLLSRNLQSNAEIEFIDYDYYFPSKEPAAFFITRVNDGDKNLGWMVFQFAINAINSTLSDHQELGKTGEIYLTNAEKIMITQSRLLPENTSLQLKVNTQAPNLALTETKGKKLLSDYRGVMVFSVFERFKFSGVAWVIIVEMDEDEVITNYYQANKDTILPSLFDHLSPGKLLSQLPTRTSADRLRVDINEYAKADLNEQISTYGIASCTGILISMPQRYTYLGHIYPLDDVYRSQWSKVFLNFGLWISGEESIDERRDLLEDMIARIKRFESYPYELNKLNIILAAVHTDSLEGAIDKLLEEGFFLSQITVLFDPEKSSVNILAQGGNTQSLFEWNNSVTDKKQWTELGETANLAQQVKRYF